MDASHALGRAQTATVVKMAITYQTKIHAHHAIQIRNARHAAEVPHTAIHVLMDTSLIQTINVYPAALQTVSYAMQTAA